MAPNYDRQNIDMFIANAMNVINLNPTHPQIEEFKQQLAEALQYKELFDKHLNLRRILTDDINKNKNKKIIIYEYENGLMDIIMINMNKALELLDEVNIKYEIENGNIVIRNATEKEYFIIVIVIEIIDGALIDIYQDPLKIMNEPFKFIQKLLNINPILAYRFVEKITSYFDTLINLLINHNEYQPAYYETVLELGQRYLDDEIKILFKQMTREIIRNITDIDDHGYSQEIDEMYDSSNPIEYNDLKVQWSEMKWMSYNEKKAQINYYLALILLGKPGELSADERIQLLKYLLLSGNSDEAQRLRSRYFIDYMGLPMQQPEFPINFDVETIINLAKKCL